MTRRAPATTKPALTSPPRDVPECPLRCGFAGWPTADASPYVACGGQQERHQRTPIGGKA